MYMSAKGGGDGGGAGAVAMAAAPSLRRPLPGAGVRT